MDLDFAVDLRVHTAGVEDTLKTVVVTGPLTEHTAAALRRSIAAAWLDPVPRVVLLDLAGVSALDAAGVRELLCAQWHGELVVCRVSAAVGAALATTTAAELLRVRDGGRLDDPAARALTVHRGR